MKHAFRISVLSAAIIGLTACLGGGGDDDGAATDNGGDSTTTSAEAFPSGLALASPTARASSVNARVVAAAAGGGAAGGSQYQWATAKISELLAGTASAKDVFDANMLLQASGRAQCYGPSMNFTAHPDTNSGDPNYNGQLPGGDLGIWSETEQASGQVCAAAQLNMQMQGVSSRAIMGLIGLASMVSVANKNSVALPGAGGSLDLVTYMDALGIQRVDFTQADLSLNADGTTWSYTLALTYSEPSPSTTTHDVVVELTHTPGASDDVYEGILNYSVSGDFSGGNCGGGMGGGGGGGMVTSDATMNGTLYYKRSSATDLVVNAREGGYCGKGTAADTVADTGVDTSGTYLLLDPADSYNNSSNTNGWANNFSIMAAKFDPSTQAGDYVYAWQAGMGDSHTRTFQVHVNADATTGEAYFGYGSPMNSADGKILGMICNWAGPGGNHTPVNYVQRQSIAFDSASGKFEVGATGSDITYAPTNSCAYEGTPSGFLYDRDLNNTADVNDKVLVYSSTSAPAGELDLDLMDKGSAASMQDAIDASAGFTLPPY
jgi:hypothetical protein